MKVQKKLSNNEIKSLFITVNKLNEIHSSQDSKEKYIIEFVIIGKTIRIFTI